MWKCDDMDDSYLAPKNFLVSIIHSKLCSLWCYLCITIFYSGTICVVGIVSVIERIVSEKVTVTVSVSMTMTMFMSGATCFPSYICSYGFNCYLNNYFDHDYDYDFYYYYICYCNCNKIKAIFTVRVALNSNRKFCTNYL